MRGPICTRGPEQWPHSGAGRTPEFTLTGLFGNIGVELTSPKIFTGLGTLDHPVPGPPAWWLEAYEDAERRNYFDLDGEGLPPRALEPQEIEQNP